jgi:hypothetical protein
MGEKLLAEMLKGSWCEISQFADQTRFDFLQVGVYQVAQTSDGWHCNTGSRILGVVGP